MPVVSEEDAKRASAGHGPGAGRVGPDAEWKEGPDNLWCLRDGQYLLFEAKSQVLAGRKEITKDEADQMNRSVAWMRVRRRSQPS